MGIALAAGAIVGAQAARNPGLLIVLFGLLGATLATLAASQPRRIVACLIAGVATGFVAGWLHPSAPPPPLVSRPTVIEARVVSDPDATPGGVSTVVRWRDADGARRESLALLPLVPAVGRGDQVEIAGTVEGVRGERVFAERARVIERADAVELARRSVRSWLESIITQRVPGGQGALSLGLLIGDDSALPGDDRDALRRAGLSHITAVSGWNVTLVTGSIGAVFLALGLRGWRWTLAQAALMFGYVWMVGLDPPVTRAALMAVVALAGARVGRPGHSITALALAAAAMAALSPDILSSLSFQLSVLSTLALIAAMRLTEARSALSKVLVTPTLASALTGLATAPILATTLGTLSLATVPANVLAGPLVPVASLGGVVIAALSPIPALSEVAGWGVWLLCSVILFVARACAGLPLAYFEFTPLSGAAAAVAHVSVFMLVAAITPEGRLIRRRLEEWAREKPQAAFAAWAGAAGVLAGAAFLL